MRSAQATGRAEGETITPVHAGQVFHVRNGTPRLSHYRQYQLDQQALLEDALQITYRTADRAIKRAETLPLTDEGQRIVAQIKANIAKHERVIDLFPAFVVEVPGAWPL